jgi:multiple sugar transport system permease protein
VYERYGFAPLETPAFENIETLLGKYGEEGNKLIFKILKRGEHEASGEADLALRYDLTVPLSRVIAQYLHLSDRLWSLILIYPSFTIPFATWLLMGFFKSIPQELEDAALVDGCSRFGTLLRIVLPVSLPGILTVVIFTFSLVLNEFLYAITFISSSTNRTLTIGVPTELIRGDLYDWPGIMAAILIPSIPLALVYNAFLNRFIAGFTGGAFR